MAEYRIVASVDPAGATAGAAKVKQELSGIKTAAAATKTSLNNSFDGAAFDKSIGSLITRLESLEKGLVDVVASNSKVASSNSTMVRSLDAMASSAGKASATTKNLRDNLAAQGTAAASAGQSTATAADKVTSANRRATVAAEAAASSARTQTANENSRAAALKASADAAERLKQAQDRVKEAHAAVGRAGGSVSLQRGESVTLSPGGSRSADPAALAAAERALAQARAEVAEATKSAAHASEIATRATQAQGTAAQGTAKSTTAAATAATTAATSNTNLAGAGQRAAQSQAALDASTRRVLQAIGAESSEVQKMNALLNDAKRALDAGTISQEQYARVQRLATQGSREATTQTGAQKAGYQQLGFQLNDIVTSLQGGASPLTVFAQQASQLGQAFQLITSGGGGGGGGGKDGGGAQGATEALDDLNGAVGTGKELYGNAKDAAGSLGTALNKQAAAAKASTGSTTTNTASTAENAVAHGTAATAANADATALGRNAAAATVDAAANTADAAATGLLARAKLQLVSIMSGPWGAAIIAGVVVLGSLAQKLFESKKGVADLIKEMEKDAKETELNRQAKERFEKTATGVAIAIRDSTKATKEAAEAERSSAERSNIAAKENLAEEISIRRKTAARLADAKAVLAGQLAEARRPTQSGEVAALRVPALQREVDRLETERKEQEALVKEAEARVLETRADLATEAARRAVDPIAQINRQYDEQVRAARAAAVATGKVTDQLTRQITAIENRRKAAIAAQNVERRDRGPLTGFIDPVQGGRITSPFGPRRAPTAGASTFHKGIDIAAPAGTPVRAAAGGVVIHAGRLGGLGNAIIVDHGGGTITEYGHLSSILTQRGQRVNQGDNIGRVGSTGISTGNHLDYRVKSGGRYVDPRGARFRTDETAVDLRVTRAAEAAERKAEQEREARERKAEQERDFVQSVVDQAAARGAGDRAESLQARIDRVLADFNRRFDRAANDNEKATIGKALTDADSRETAQRFESAYVEPLKRLQALQGKVGLDREVLNRQLDEAALRGRDLTTAEAALIDRTVRHGDALTRQAEIAETATAALDTYRRTVAALAAALANGSINQNQFNSRMADLGQGARDTLMDMPGIDPATGVDYSTIGARAEEDARYAKEQEALDNNRAELLRIGVDYDALVEAAAKRHAENMAKIDRGVRDARVQSAQSISESLLSIAENSVGQQSAIYKALFITTKAFAIADASIKGGMALAQALTLPFPANLAAIATVAASAATVVQNIQGIALNLADGGHVRGPGGPRSDSIPANLSHGEYVVNADATSRNLPLLEAINSGQTVRRTRQATNDNAAMAASAARPRVMVQQHAGVAVETRENMTTGDVEIIAQRVLETNGDRVFAAALERPNSRSRKTLSRTTTAKGRKS